MQNLDVAPADCRKALDCSAAPAMSDAPVAIDPADELNPSHAALASADAASCELARSSSSGSRSVAQISLFAPPPSATSGRVQPSAMQSVVVAASTLARIDELDSCGLLLLLLLLPFPPSPSPPFPLLQWVL